MRWDNLPLNLLVVMFILFVACDGNKEVIPDVSAIEVDLDVRRFERDLKLVSADTGANGATTLRATYPIFFDSVWLELMLPARKAGYDSALVAAFGMQPALTRLLDSVSTRFPENSSQHWQDDLQQAFKYAKHYFPDSKVPPIVTYVSELGLGTFTYDNTLLGIGLDFYMGRNFSAYDPNVFPQYIQRSMNADHIASRAIEAWVTGLLGETPGDRMLDIMIHNGKLLYIKDRLLPHVSDTAVLGFSESQLNWLSNNELEIWAHYLDEELLYETKSSRIGKHTGPSPNAPGMPPEAPGGNANWMGMKIIEQFMSRRPNLTLQDLIDEKDAQVLLSQSKYKPAR